MQLETVEFQGNISRAEGRKLFQSFAENDYCEKHGQVRPQDVVEALTAICNEAFRAAKEAVNDSKEEAAITSMSVGEKCFTLFRDYEKIVQSTIHDRWGIKLTRMPNSRHDLPDAPQKTKTLAIHRPYCYDYLLNWDTDNPHLTPKITFDDALSPIELLRGFNRTRSKSDNTYTDIKFAFKDRSGTVKEYPVYSPKMMCVPYFYTLFNLQGFEEINKKTIPLEFPCEQKHFDWAINYIYTTEFYPPENAPNETPGLEDYVMMAHLASYLRFPTLMLHCCRALAEQIDDENVFTIAAMSAELQSTPPAKKDLASLESKSPDQLITKHITTLLASCREHLRLHPNLWKNLKEQELDSELLVQLYYVSLAMVHAPMQHLTCEILKERINTPETVVPTFQALTKFLLTQPNNYIVFLQNQAAENLNLLCDNHLRDLLHKVARNCDDLRPKQLDLDVLQNLFKFSTLAHVPEASNWCCNQLKARLHEGNWLSIASTAWTPLVRDSDNGIALKEAINTYLQENEHLSKTQYDERAKVETLAQTAWVGEVLKIVDTMEKPASALLNTKLAEQTKVADVRVVFDLCRQTSSIALTKVLTTFINGAGGHALKEIDGTLHTNILHYLDKHSP